MFRYVKVTGAERRESRGRGAESPEGRAGDRREARFDNVDIIGQRQGAKRVTRCARDGADRRGVCLPERFARCRFLRSVFGGVKTGMEPPPAAAPGADIPPMRRQAHDRPNERLESGTRRTLGPARSGRGWGIQFFRRDRRHGEPARAPDRDAIQK